MTCEWCRNPNGDDDVDPFELCLTHQAEYEGCTIDYLERHERKYLDELE